MGSITDPDLQYFNTLLKRDSPATEIEEVWLDNASPDRLVKRFHFQGQNFIWRKTNHKDVRLNVLLAQEHPTIAPVILDHYVEGTQHKVNDSSAGWIVYLDFGFNNLIEGEFKQSILDTLVTIHSQYRNQYDRLKFVPQYRPRLLGQAVRCHLLPPLKALLGRYQASKKLQELWVELEAIVYHYTNVTQVFTEGNLTLVNGAINNENVFIDIEGRCRLLNWAEAHWASPYIDLSRLLSLGFEYEHLFQYIDLFKQRIGVHIDEQRFVFCLNLATIHVLFERVSWRARQLRALKPEQIEQERDLVAEIDLIYRLLAQGVSIYTDLKEQASSLGYSFQ